MDREILDFVVCQGEAALSHVDLALRLLWFLDSKRPDCEVTSGTLARTIYEAGLGNPNATALRASLQKSGKVVVRGRLVCLKHGTRVELTRILSKGDGRDAPVVDHRTGYLPHAVWTSTRPYVESVCEQLNGCFECRFFDACSVMLRRLLETLIIEAYEHEDRLPEIQGPDGNFVMLRELISRATASNGLSLGRDAKCSLDEVKKLGDRAAHNRRFVAGKADLERVQSGVRVAAQELIHIASLQRASRRA